MSKVYSFRLDSNNPRESQARDVIDAWVSQGYSLRYILTDALISHRENGDGDIGWDKIYDQLSELVQKLGNGMVKERPIGNNPSLSPDFVEAMKKAAKDGFRSGDILKGKD